MGRETTLIDNACVLDSRVCSKARVSGADMRIPKAFETLPFLLPMSELRAVKYGDSGPYHEVIRISDRSNAHGPGKVRI